MNKKLKATITISTAIAGSILMANAQEAKANEVTEPVQGTESELVIKTKEGKTTSKDVESAKAELDKANAIVDDKSKDVEKKTEGVTKAEAKVKDAQADLDKVKDVTPDTIKEAQNKVDAIKEDKAKTETKKQEAEVAKEEIDKDVEKKAQEAKDAFKSADEKQAGIRDVEKQISELKDSTKLLAEKQVAKEQVGKELETAKSELAKRQAELDKAIKDDADQTAEIERLAKKVEEQQQKVKEVETQLELAKKAEAKAKSKLENTVNPFGNANTKLRVSEDFVKALKAFKENPTKENFDKAVEAEQADTENKLHHPHPSDYENDTDLIDLKNLSKEDKELFSQYFAYLLNQVRAQFGLPPRKYNLNVQKFADDIAENIMKDKYDEPQHYIKGITDAARKHGLSDKGNFYENQAYVYAPLKDGSKVSRRFMFDFIHNSAQWFFYEGKANGSYGHAMSFIRDHENTAVSFSTTSREFYGSYMIKMSVIHVAKNTMNDQSKYEETYGKTSAESKDAVTLPDTQELEEAYNLAKLNTARVQAELDTAKQALEQAKAEHKAKVDSVESKVDEAQKAKELAEKVVTDLEEQERQINDDIARIQGYIDNETAENARLTAELEKLKGELATIKADASAKVLEYNALKAQSETKAEEIAKIEEEIAKLNKLLVPAEAELAEQLRLDASRADLQRDLEIAKEELALAKDELGLARDELADVQKKVKAKYDAYVVVKNRYELEKLKYGTTKDAPTVEKPEFDIKSLNKLTKPVNPTNSTTTVEKETSNIPKGAILPKTGENSNSSVALGLMVLVASLVMNRRKVK